MVSAMLLFPTTVHAQPGASYPGLCDEFRVGMVQRDSGTAIEWFLDLDCAFTGEIREVVVTTTEDGATRDRHVIPANRPVDDRIVRRVGLASKPPCSSSEIVVEARYSYLGTGDVTSDRRTIFYEPDDRC